MALDLFVLLLPLPVPLLALLCNNVVRRITTTRAVDAMNELEAAVSCREEPIIHGSCIWNLSKEFLVQLCEIEVEGNEVCPKASPTVAGES